MPLLKAIWSGAALTGSSRTTKCQVEAQQQSESPQEEPRVPPVSHGAGAGRHWSEHLCSRQPAGKERLATTFSENDNNFKTHVANLPRQGASFSLK